MNTSSSPKRMKILGLLSLLVVTALFLAACTAVPAQAPAPEAAATVAPAAEGDPMMTVFGEKLPDDALPYAEQVYREPCDITANQTTVDFMVAVYQRFCTGDSSFSLALVDLDRDFNVIPMAAESWEVSEDGLTWTFHLRPGMMWSDDTPVTANDWVQTYRYAADPEHAWDFAWYYAGVIKNWDEVIAGELPLEELGVTAVDDLTLQIETYKPFPPLPGMMHFAWPMQAKALAEHGPYYNNNPETSVSSGRWKLVSLEPGKKIVLEPNEKFKGPNPPQLEPARDHLHGSQHLLRSLPEWRSGRGGLRTVDAGRLRHGVGRPGPERELPAPLRRLPHRLPALRHLQPALQRPQRTQGLCQGGGPREHRQERLRRDQGHAGLLVPDARLPLLGHRGRAQRVPGV